MEEEINENYILVPGQFVPLPEHEVYSVGVALPGTKCISTHDGVRAGKIEEIHTIFGGSGTTGALSVAMAHCRFCDYVPTIGRSLETGDYYIGDRKYWGN